MKKSSNYLSSVRFTPSSLVSFLVGALSAAFVVSNWMTLQSCNSHLNGVSDITSPHIHSLPSKTVGSSTGNNFNSTVIPEAISLLEPLMTAVSRRKFYQEDLHSFFNVRLLNRVIIDPLLSDVMKTPHYDISKDSDFKEANDDELIELYGPIIELGFAEDRRFSVQFVNVDRGYGLFAEVPIQKGRVVGEYTGVLTEDDSDSDYQWTYKGEVRRNSSTKPLELSTDARYAGNLMRFVNDGPNPNIDSVFVPWKGIWRVLYVAKRFIAEGEECIVSYGSEYWSSRTNEH